MEIIAAPEMADESNIEETTEISTLTDEQLAMVGGGQGMTVL